MNKKFAFSATLKASRKNGKVGSIQLYKCKDCGKQFRGVKRLDIDQLSDDYVFGCQSVNRLAAKYVVFKDAWTSKILWRKFIFIMKKNLLNAGNLALVGSVVVVFGVLLTCCSKEMQYDQKDNMQVTTRSDDFYWQCQEEDC